MNNRERALSLLAGESPDRLPWFADLDYWASAEIIRGLRPHGWQSQPSYFQLHQQLDVGFYLQGHFAYQAIADNTVTIVEENDGRLRQRTITTPKGTLHECWELMSTSFSWAPREHMVKSPEDLDALTYWYDHTAYLPDPAPAERRRQLAGDNGIVLVYLPRSPFMELTVNLAGIATVVELWLSHRERLEDCLRIVGEASDRAALASLAVSADAYMIPENLSSEVVGKRFYREYVQPWESRWVEAIRRNGHFSFIHMDGTLRGLLHDVAQTGFDVIEAMTPAPVGDLPLDEWREWAGSGPVLWGGLPGAWFTPLVDDETFHAEVERTIATMRADRRMVLGVADQVPPDGTLARVAAVADHLTG